MCGINAFARLDRCIQSSHGKLYLLFVCIQRWSCKRNIRQRIHQPICKLVDSYFNHAQNTHTHTAKFGEIPLRMPCVGVHCAWYAHRLHFNHGNQHMPGAQCDADVQSARSNVCVSFGSFCMPTQMPHEWQSVFMELSYRKSDFCSFWLVA